MRVLPALFFVWAVLGAEAARAVDVDQVGETTDTLVDDALGTWLDPTDPIWEPLRGERFEVSILMGGEGGAAGLAPDKLPTIGGMGVNVVGRYYPVDRLAVAFGGRGYFGLDGAPATGTTASSVVTALTGVRYDLVRENRFSLAWDFYSGPSLFVFTDLLAATVGGESLESQLAVGGEMGSGLAMRYSLGPFTGELRGIVGGRAGATSGTEQVSGPFSALFAALDLGATWGM